MDERMIEEDLRAERDDPDDREWVEVDCTRCQGTGGGPDGYCWECDGKGYELIPELT